MPAPPVVLVVLLTLLIALIVFILRIARVVVSVILSVRAFGDERAVHVDVVHDGKTYTEDILDRGRIRTLIDENAQTLDLCARLQWRNELGRQSEPDARPFGRILRTGSFCSIGAATDKVKYVITGCQIESRRTGSAVAPKAIVEPELGHRRPLDARDRRSRRGAIRRRTVFGQQESQVWISVIGIQSLTVIW